MKQKEIDKFGDVRLFTKRNEGYKALETTSQSCNGYRSSSEFKMLAGVVVDLQVSELEPFIYAMKPDGLYLCIAADEEDQVDIIKRIEKW